MKKPYEIVKDMREDADLTQTEIAEIIGTSQQHYSKYENGSHDIPAHIFIKLADYYNVSLEYLMGRTKNTTGINALNRPITSGYTSGELMEDVLSLDEAGKTAVVEFVQYQKNKNK